MHRRAVLTLMAAGAAVSLAGCGSKKAKENLAAADAFMAQNAKQPGVVTLPEGLQYKVILITDAEGAHHAPVSARVIIAPVCDAMIAPLVFAGPIQLLAYYTAVQKGADVDQPRNLAKSVTVE